jgi:uncharacterized protein (TIGR00251 family)
MFRIESQRQKNTVRFAVYAQPRASRSEIAGEHGDALRIRLAAPPVDGAANTELVSFLANKLGVSKSAVRLVQGERGRQKLVEIEGLDSEEIVSRLGLNPSV